MFRWLEKGREIPFVILILTSTIDAFSRPIELSDFCSVLKTLNIRKAQLIFIDF